MFFIFYSFEFNVDALHYMSIYNRLYDAWKGLFYIFIFTFKRNGDHKMVKYVYLLSRLILREKEIASIKR